MGYTQSTPQAFSVTHDCLQDCCVLAVAVMWQTCSHAQAPKASENFRCLCTGEKGVGKASKKALHYKVSAHILHAHTPSIVQSHASLRGGPEQQLWAPIAIL